ncbi:MAG: ATP-binding protein [Ignavibacteriales bacterium]|nr:ATP-binding protein [Ignavibacteriales bacterium]
MTRKKILEIIEQGEGLNVEFKQRFSSHEKVAKEMLAFANTKGGVIVFGIDDDKSIYGVESEKEESELIKEAAEKYCEPPLRYSIKILNIEDKEIVIAEIPESQNKPHRLQDYKNEIDLNTAAVYIRINDKSVLASKEMIKIFQTQEKNIELKKYEIGIVEKLIFEYLENNETITVDELKKFANISYRRASRALIKLVRANALFIHTKDNGEDYFSSLNLG